MFQTIQSPILAFKPSIPSTPLNKRPKLHPDTHKTSHLNPKRLKRWAPNRLKAIYVCIYIYIHIVFFVCFCSLLFFLLSFLVCKRHKTLLSSQKGHCLSVLIYSVFLSFFLLVLFFLSSLFSRFFIVTFFASLYFLSFLAVFLSLFLFSLSFGLAFLLVRTMLP